jgi:hypothetical protein
MNLQLGYRLRDYLYHKTRFGNNIETLHEIKEEDDAYAMIACNEEKRQAGYCCLRTKK